RQQGTMTRRRRILIVAGSLLLAILAGWWLLPKPELYPGNGFSAAIYSADGELLRLSLAPDERYRLQLPVERIAPAMVQATLLYEDRHFFQHPGFDPFALLRAAWSTYIGGERAVGGSTITMQLARLRFGLET